MKYVDQRLIEERKVTKDEISQDELIGELRKYRDEVDVTTARSVENKDRIEKFEKTVSAS